MATKTGTTRKTTTKAKSTRATKESGSSSSSGSIGKLVIVESPAKARTIGKYLGRGYTVTASMGHIRDLPKSTMGVEVENNFEPQYKVPMDKRKLVKELKDKVSKAREVYLATDPDREGEAIAWHLVKATDADEKKVHRVVFQEITPDAVREAMEHPREIDMDLVDAQQARRVLDRLVGYTVSPLLWKKVKRGLSAGRVQSAALRILVDREREIEAFVPVEYWSLEADVRKHGGAERDRFRTALQRVNGKAADLKTEPQTTAIVDALEGATWRVDDIRQRETRRRPQAPFTTSTLQQEASRKLRYPVRRTMQIAQELYEGVDLGPEGTQGIITYMRTDSTNIASVAQQAARTAIAGKFGDAFLPAKPPVYNRKSKGAQEAHEAVRPTSPGRDPESIKAFLTPQQYRLYQLVWQRFMASQMADAILDGTTIDVGARPKGTAADGEAPYVFRATGSVVRFPGWMAVYTMGRDEGDSDELDEGALPKVEVGDPIDLLELLPEQHFTQPPPRYSEATLVKALEEAGIGRPSTYAPTIATLQARSYVAVDERKLVPTELGMVVSDLLSEHIPSVFDVQFTSAMEEELDEIATGDRAWQPTMAEFYDPFIKSVNTATETMGKVKLKDEPAGEDCEKCGRPMLIKLGKYGKFMACSGFPDCRNAKPLLTRIGVPCPTCKEGEIVERRSKKGRAFYGCIRYPECDFVSWGKPVLEPCPQCGGYMVEAGRRGQVRCPACSYAGELLQKAG